MPDRIKKLKRALGVIKASQRWLPSLVQAMSDAGVYGKKWPERTAFITSKDMLQQIEECIQTEAETGDLRKKWVAILKPGSLYELSVVDYKVLVQVIRFNKDSVKVKRLASTDEKEDFQLIRINADPGGWYFCCYSLNSFLKTKEVHREDLPLYVGMNTTEHYEALLKGD